MNYSKVLDDFLTFLRKIELDYNIAVKEENEINNKTQDILHQLEIDDHSYNENAKLAKGLKLVRQQRREYKDLIRDLDPLMKWYKENQRVIRDLEAVLGIMRKTEKNFESRTYIKKSDIIEIIKEINYQKLKQEDIK